MIKNTSDRLKELMRIKNIKQKDILILCQPLLKKYDVKLNKSDISQYVSGKATPRQDKMKVLALGLNVSEAWLMGFDVPMIDDKSSDPQITNLVNRYQQLNDDGRKKVDDYIDDLLEMPKYHR